MDGIVRRPGVHQPQHRRDPDTDAPRPVCGTTLPDPDVWCVGEYSPSAPVCRHQACFGKKEKRPREDAAIAADVAAYDDPVVRTTSTGTIHRLDEDADVVAPACDTRLESGEYEVVEAADVPADAPRCRARHCFRTGPTAQSTADGDRENPS